MFDNTSESVAYVRDVMLSNLRAINADARLSDFKSFTLEGTWARPTAVWLWADANPRLDDAGVLVRFVP
jgi:hypothetical protein